MLPLNRSVFLYPCDIFFVEIILSPTFLTVLLLRPQHIVLDKLLTLPWLLTSYLPSYPVIGFQISFSFIEYHFLIFNCGCFCYLNDCILPCFNQRLPVIFIGLVILFPFPSISSALGKIIPILVCHI